MSLSLNQFIAVCLSVLPEQWLVTVTDT